MAVSAEQFKISLVGFPVLQSTTHDVVSVLGPMFLAGVNMMDIEASEIIKATADALPAKGFHDFELALPFPFAMYGSIVLVPILTLTNRGTITCLAFLSTLPAFSIVRPAVSKITFLTAILSSSVSDSIGVHGKCLTAMGAYDGNWWCSHGMTLSKYSELVNTKYFDIAYKRIAREYDQLKLFPPEEKRDAVQEELGI